MNQECWLEMDLYGLQGGPADQRVRDLFDRLSPIWTRRPEARKGLSLCIGWLMDSVLFWNDDPDAEIPTCQPPTYETWTYRRLAETVSLLKGEAARRGIDDFHVALMFLGTRSMEMNEYAGFSGRTEEARHTAGYYTLGRWFDLHPEVFDDRFDVVYFGAPVSIPEDEQVCSEPSASFGRYLADKLCSFGTFTGIDAVVFRDHVFTPAYIRGNRRGRFADPSARDALNRAITDMLGRIKRNRPDFITIGYSSGVSSMEEWRSQGFDLERVAATGYLDIWITQTWGSAWQDYWPCHSQGYSFQLANVLVNLAMLANTPCKHVFLIETFDAWEPWDSIHQYPSKVAWEIRAYSHATLRLPDGGMRRPDGFYSSWMNRRGDFIPEATVGWLRDRLEACSRDLDQNPLPGGPCLVYDRAGLEHLLDRPASCCRGEAMDDWAGLLLKYGVPLLSVTRGEWLDQIDADGYLVPATAHLPAVAVDHLLDEIQRGKPTLFMGQTDSLPQSIRQTLGLAIEPTPMTAHLPEAATVHVPLCHSLGTRGLVVNQRRRSMMESSNWVPLITCLDGPIFSGHRSLPVWIWETPEWGTPFELHLDIETVGSPQLYSAVAETWSAGGWGRKRLVWHNDETVKPVCFLFWRMQDGTSRCLLANLEQGLFGNSQFVVSGTLLWTDSVTAEPVAEEGFPKAKVVPLESGTHVFLRPHRSAVLRR